MTYNHRDHWVKSGPMHFFFFLVCLLCFVFSKVLLEHSNTFVYVLFVTVFTLQRQT